MPDHTAARALGPQRRDAHFFDELAEQPDKQDMRYVLDAAAGPPPRIPAGGGAARAARPGGAGRVLSPPRSDVQVPAVLPPAETDRAIQEELASLLQ